MRLHYAKGGSESIVCRAQGSRLTIMVDNNGIVMLFTNSCSRFIKVSGIVRVARVKDQR